MNRTHLEVVAKRLRTADLANCQEQHEVFEQLREIRSNFDETLDAESQRSLDAASLLISYLARMGTMAGEDVRAIAVRLLETVCQLEAGSNGPPSEARPAGQAQQSPPEAPPIPAAPSASRVRVIKSTRGQGTPTGRDAKLPADRTTSDTLGDMMLGQILLRRGQILEEHLQHAARVQRTTGLRIGDIFVKIGAATRAQVADALAYQAACRRTRESLPSGPAPTREEQPRSGLKLMGEVLLGEVLVERGTVTRRQLERALEVQKTSGIRLGEALVQLGATTQEHIELALRVQSQERRFGTKPGPGAGPGNARR